MGLFLSNLHIKKNSNVSVSKLKAFLLTDMISKGYTQVDDSENAEIIAAIYAPENSEWISVSSDCYNFNDDHDTKIVAEPISEKFETDVIAMSCMDSDYAFMHLINHSEKTDGWVNSGSPYEGMKLPRRTSASRWKNIVSDFDKFKAIIKEDNIFAEDVFFGTAELLNMDKDQCVFEADRTEELDDNCLIKLYFSLPAGTKKALPKLHIDLYDLCPCKANVNSVVFVNNIGGRSKGVAVMFTGDYIENDDVVIYDVTFESDYGSEKRKCVPITLEKRKRADGKYVLWWADKNFQIPPAVNPNLPLMKRMNLQFKKQFGVRFFVKGNPEKFRDVEVYIIPLENVHDGYAEGYARWNVQKRP